MLFLPIHQRQIIKNIFIKPRRYRGRPNRTLQQRSKSIFFLDILTIFTFDNVEASLDFLDIIFEGTVVVAYVVFEGHGRIVAVADVGECSGEGF